jgi:hypothetical protein
VRYFIAPPFLGTELLCALRFSIFLIIAVIVLLAGRQPSYQYFIQDHCRARNRRKLSAADLKLRSIQIPTRFCRHAMKSETTPWARDLQAHSPHSSGVHLLIQCELSATTPSPPQLSLRRRPTKHKRQISSSLSAAAARDKASRSPAARHPLVN